MLEVLLWFALIVPLLAMLLSFDRTGDVFHPVILIAPMLTFLYGWMPMKLVRNGGLDGFFAEEQVLAVQALNCAGIVALLWGCMSVIPRRVACARQVLSNAAATRLLVGGILIGSCGLLAWSTTVRNVGGFAEAFGRAYSGGWDDSGYVRDGVLLLVPGILLIVASASASSWRVVHLCAAFLFASPWIVQAILTSRRGPTFMIAVTLGLSLYLHRNKRPPVLAVGAGGVALGLLMLFLISNRGGIYLGSEHELRTDVSSVVQMADPGNEFVYGTGTVLHIQQTRRHFWGKRYLAQVVVRPVPSSIWPTKYEDFGVPELLLNAGTAGEGFSNTLGWEPAIGSAPGLIADVYVEFWYLAFPALWLIGKFYGWIWSKAVTSGGYWITQYVCIAGLTAYLIMQTIEAVIFRLLLMSVPLGLAWYAAELAEPAQQGAMHAQPA